MLIAVCYCKLLYKVLRWRLCFRFSSLPSGYLSTGLCHEDRQLGLLAQPEANVLLFSSNGILNCELNLSQSLTFSCLPMKPKTYTSKFLERPQFAMTEPLQCAHLGGYAVLKCSYWWLFFSSAQDDPAQAQPFCSCIFFQHAFLENTIALDTFQTWSWGWCPWSHNAYANVRNQMVNR